MFRWLTVYIACLCVCDSLFVNLSLLRLVDCLFSGPIVCSCNCVFVWLLFVCVSICAFVCLVVFVNVLVKGLVV